ncbi:MAG: sensor histidine kinase [Chloroflexota bacterium]
MKHIVSAEFELIPAFRRFAWLWLGVMVLFYLIFMISPIDVPDEQARRLWHVLLAGSIVAYLSSTWLQQRLASFYLPVALGLMTFAPVVIQIGLAPAQPVNIGDFPFPLFGVILNIVRLFVLWIIVVIMIAWKYRFRYVIVFAVTMGGVNIMMVNLLNQLPSDALIPFSAIVVFFSLAFVLVGYVVVLLTRAERNQRQALADANAKIAQYASTLEQLTISRERNRMARELHDTLAHTLSGLAVQLETTKAYWDQDEGTARELLDQSLDATRSGLTETRRALQSLRASPIEDLGLKLALEQLGHSATERTGLKITYRLPEQMPTMTAPVEQCIFRIAQEALANVVKHAAATQVTLALQTADDIVLTIRDDGKGFQVDQNPKEGHYGLLGMQERASLVSGMVTLTSTLGQGTTVTLTIPLEPIQEQGTS